MTKTEVLKELQPAGSERARKTYARIGPIEVDHGNTDGKQPDARKKAKARS